jgi:hypothetical protein
MYMEINNIEQEEAFVVEYMRDLCLRMRNKNAKFDAVVRDARATVDIEVNANIR